MWFIGYLEHRGDIILVVGHKCSTAVSGPLPGILVWAWLAANIGKMPALRRKASALGRDSGESFQGIGCWG